MAIHYNGKKEIVWSTVSQEEIGGIFQELGSTELTRHGIEYFGKAFAPQNVSYADKDFHKRLSEKFKLSEAKLDCPELTFIQTRRKTDMAAGYLTDDFQTALVVGDGFGLFKSVISGFASLQLDSAGFVPAHAAALSLNGRGALLIGGHGAGKTTTLLNAAIHAISTKIDVAILCDDWLIVKPHDGRLIATTFDPSISLTTSDLTRAISLTGVASGRLLDSLNGRDKISVGASGVFDRKIQAQEIAIDAIVILNPVAGRECFTSIPDEGVPDFIVDAAYHFPYAQGNIVHKHLEFWRQWVGILPVYEYSHSGEIVSESSMSNLVDAILPK